MGSKELIMIFLAFKFQPSVLGSEILSLPFWDRKKTARFFFFQKESILDWRSYHLDTFGEHGRYTKISIPRNPNGWRLEPPQKMGFFGLMFSLESKGAKVQVPSSNRSALRQLNFLRDGTEVYNNLRYFLSKPSICQACIRVYESIKSILYTYVYKYTQ